MDRDKSKNEVGVAYLMSVLKEKDEKILRLKSKIEDLKKQCTEKSSRENQTPEMSMAMEKPAAFLGQINTATGNRFNTVDDCIALIKKLTEDTYKKLKRDYSKDEVKDSSPYSSDKQRRYDVEIEELNDKIYDLELKMKFQEKKFKIQLTQKNDEIEELNDDIELIKSAKSKDTKFKNRIIDLEGKIEELEYELESKFDEIKQKDRKIKDLTDAKKNTTVNEDELKKLNMKYEEELKRWKEQAADLTRQIEQSDFDKLEAIKEKDQLIEKKDVALEKMKDKIKVGDVKLRESVDQINYCNEQFNTLNEELLECQNSLQKEAEKSRLANTQKEQLEMKIRTLEKEIYEMNQNRVMNKPAMPQPQWNRHEDQHVATGTMRNAGQVNVDRTGGSERACPNCRVIFDEDELEDHILMCLVDED